MMKPQALAVLALLLPLLMVVASASKPPPIWQPGAVYVTIYGNGGCNDSDVKWEGNITEFNTCVHAGSSYGLQISRDLLQPARALEATLYAATYCSSPYGTTDVPLNGTCAQFAKGYSVQFETYYTIAPVTTYSQCQDDGIWLQPGGYSDLSVHRMTVENITLIDDAASSTLLSQSVYWTSLHNGVCAFAPNNSNVFMTVDFKASLTNKDIKYPKKQELAVRTTETTINLVGGNNDYTQDVAGKVAHLLNKECSCDADIEVGKGPVTVDPTSCKPPLPDTFWLCWLISGSPLFIQASAVDESAGTWEHSYLNDSLRHRESTRELQLGPFEQTTNNDQDECDFDLWNKCESLVTEAVHTCEPHTDAPWNDLCVIQVMGQKGLNKCCPCAVRYRNQKDVDWLDRRCYPRY